MFKILRTYICWKKYIKCNIWRVAVRPSYIQDARFLKVNSPETVTTKPRRSDSFNVPKKCLKLSAKELAAQGQEGRDSSKELLCLQLSPTRDNKQPVFFGSDKYVREWKRRLSMNTSALKYIEDGRGHLNCLNARSRGF